MTSIPDRPIAAARGQRARRRVFGGQGLRIGVAALALMALAAAAAPLLPLADPYAQDLSHRLIPPIWRPGGNWAHPLGADHLGRDYLSRIVFGAQISLLIGFCSALVSGVIGVTLGLVAGYFRGRVDLVVTFLITLRLSMPVVVVALAAAAILGASLRTVIIVLGLLIWDRYAVVTRAAALQARASDYVTAARAAGCSPLRIMFGEIAPNIAGQIAVVASIEMAHAVLLEAALSFLGLGVQPPAPSWGLMIAEARQNILFEPWLIAIPGACLFALVLAVNLVGDGVRDLIAREDRR